MSFNNILLHFLSYNYIKIGFYFLALWCSRSSFHSQLSFSISSIQFFYIFYFILKKMSNLKSNEVKSHKPLVREPLQRRKSADNSEASSGRTAGGANDACQFKIRRPTPVATHAPLTRDYWI